MNFSAFTCLYKWTRCTSFSLDCMYKWCNQVYIKNLILTAWLVSGFSYLMDLMHAINHKLISERIFYFSGILCWSFLSFLWQASYEHEEVPFCHGFKVSCWLLNSIEVCLWMSQEPLIFWICNTYRVTWVW